MAEKVEPHEDWTKAEEWAWKQIQEGEVADFNEKLGETADPAKPGDWNDRRTLRRQFLEAIIEEPYRIAIHRKGIRITGALVPAEEGLSLDWERADLPWEIWLDRSRFTADVRMRDAKINGVFLLEGSKFEGALDMERLSIEQSLFIRGGAHFDGEVVLADALVGGQLDAEGSQFQRAVNMERLSVKKDLFLRNGAYFSAEVNLRSASIKGYLDASGAHFKRSLEMEGLSVGKHLFLRDKACFDGPINLLFAKVKGVLALSDSHFDQSIDASGLCVDSELQLASSHEGHPMPTWGNNSSLKLRNAVIGALQDRLEGDKDGWPKTLDLHGCQIGQLGGNRGDGDAANMLGRKVKWWLKWLRRGTAGEYSPQPYHMLAKLFREAGYPSKANAILFAARCRERNKPEGFFQGVWLWFLWASIGFGIGRYFLRHVGFWLIGWTGYGAYRLSQVEAAEIAEKSLYWKAAASLDRLIPFVEMIPQLSQTLSKHLTETQQLYFATHSLFGWVLAALVVAGLAGLTQRA